jgi:hypothetical protein
MRGRGARRTASRGVEGLAKSHDENPPRKPRREAKTDRDVGVALKSAYDSALQEEIPQEMLDLLGKLG